MTITACSTQLFDILLTTATLLFSRNFTQDWLNYYWLLYALPCPFIYAGLLSAERSQSKGSCSRLLESSIVTACICALPFSFMLVVIGLLGSCSMYLLVCIVYTLPLVAFALSISFTLMIFVLVAFFIVLNVKRYYVVSISVTICMFFNLPAEYIMQHKLHQVQGYTQKVSFCNQCPKKSNTTPPPLLGEVIELNDLRNIFEVAVF